MKIRKVGAIHKTPRGNLLCAMQGIASPNTYSFEVQCSGKQNIESVVGALAGHYQAYCGRQGIQAMMSDDKDLPHTGRIGWQRGCWEIDIEQQLQEGMPDTYKITGNVERERLEGFHRYLCDVVRQG